MAADPESRPAAVANRDVQLDGMRGLGAITVVLFHATYFDGPTTAFGRAILTAPGLGFTAVDLFFVLSGFLITRILIRYRGATNFYTAFYARRFLRIIPVYYLLLTVCFVIVPMFETGK